jgi:tagaturonate reductase
MIRLSGKDWSGSDYRRADLPERVLQFGTGMLLRALCAASVDAANRSRRFHGRIVAVQSTPHGKAGDLNAQDGLFTLVERGLENGAPLERSRLIGSISRAFVAETHWPAVLEVACRPELQVIVSNVTEAGFESLPPRLTDVLYARFERLRDGPPVFVIPTELVPENGPRLAAMVDDAAAQHARAAPFRSWIAERVRFCASLVDRITTGMPPAEERARLEAGLRYSDTLLTVTEPYYFWAIAADPTELRAAFPIDDGSVLFAPDIRFYEQRKLRLLNGTHTALAPLALLAGVRTVRQAAEHPRLGPLLCRVVFDEIVPASDLPREEAQAFARSVVERFRNPWLEHEWRVIATNQATKLRIRVLPSLVDYMRKQKRVPEGLALCVAASVFWARSGAADELGLADDRLRDAVARWLGVLEGDGVDAALEQIMSRP